MLDAHIPDEQRTMMFGVVTLYPWQMNVITANLEGKDSLVVQPTGASKSMCFTIPSFFKSKTAIIISHIISLMTNQVSKLVKKGCIRNTTRISSKGRCHEAGGGRSISSSLHHSSHSMTGQRWSLEEYS